VQKRRYLACLPLIGLVLGVASTPASADPGTAASTSRAARSLLAPPTDPPRAHSTNTIGHSLASQQTCASVKDGLRKTKITPNRPTVGDKEYATCVEPSLDYRASTKVKPQVAQAVTTIPDWCQTTEPGTGWWFDRFGQCKVDFTEIVVFNKNTGENVGSVTVETWDYNGANPKSLQWTKTIGIVPVDVEGAAVDETISAGSIVCNGNCTVSGVDFAPQPLVKGKAIVVGATFQSTASASGAVDLEYPDVVINWLNPIADSTSTDYLANTYTRCDNAVPGLSTPGCVMYGAITYWDVYSTQLWDYVNHLTDAQLSGLPGFWDYDNQGYNDQPLTRMVDPVMQQRNGDTACPQSWPRPTGTSCDEYPMRSTYQGAWTGGGSGRTFDWCQIPQLPTNVTGPTGWSSCMIDATQNSTAGSLMNSFYVSNRLLDGDQFLIIV
jgi:hypothetical protein